MNHLTLQKLFVTLLLFHHLHIYAIILKSSSHIRYNNNKIHYCPATSLIDFNIDGFFNYPIDIFYPKYFLSLKQSLNTSITSKNYNIYNDNINYNDNEIMKNFYKFTLHNDDNDNFKENLIYNCSKPNFDENLKNLNYPYHICSISKESECPLIIDNIIDATSYMNNNKNYKNIDNIINSTSKHHHHPLHVSCIFYFDFSCITLSIVYKEDSIVQYNIHQYIVMLVVMIVIDDDNDDYYYDGSE